jgi:hypothetical protein
MWERHLSVTAFSNGPRGRTAMGVIFDTSVLIEAERGRFDTDGFIAGKEKEP